MMMGKTAADIPTIMRPSTGLTPVRKRLLFNNNNNNNLSEPTKTRNSTKEKARRLRLAIGLYFVLCVSFSVLLFTWTVTSTIHQTRPLTEQQQQQVKTGLRDPFRRIAMSRDMLTAHNHQQTDKKKSEMPQQQQASPRLRLQSGQLQSESNKDLATPSTIANVPEYLRIPDDEHVVQIVNTRYALICNAILSTSLMYHV